MKAFKSDIKQYLDERETQMREFDPEFYDKCLKVLPSQKTLDSTSVDSTGFIEDLLNERELRLVKSSLMDFIKLQKEETYSAVEVVRAFCKSAIIAQITTNCVMQFTISDALKHAAKYDLQRKNGVPIKRPFLGVPIALAEHLHLTGKKITYSYVANLRNEPLEFGNICVGALQSLGFVVIARTAQPSCSIGLETVNNITGRTRNPLNSKLSPGGSCGGAAALLAMKGVVLSIGFDINGSVRFPAAMCHVYGFKPTSARLPASSLFLEKEKTEHFPKTIGILTNHIQNIDLFMETCLNKRKPWEDDPYCVPMRYWQNIGLPKKSLMVGFAYTDGVVTPSPSVKRAMDEVMKKLEKSKRFEFTECKDQLIGFQRAYDAYMKLLVLYAKQRHKMELKKSGEASSKTMDYLESTFGRESLDITDIQTLEGILDNFRRYNHCLIKLSKMRYLLTPAYVLPGEVPENATYCGYTAIFNIMDQPSMVIPTKTKHSVELDVLPENFKLNDNEHERRVWLKNGKINYRSEAYRDLPICVQLSGKRFEDDKFVATVKLMNDILNS